MANTKVYVIYYSLHGHVEIMAREVHRGASSVLGVEATLWQVPETLSERILEKMKSPPKANDVTEIKPEQLVDADGFLFGFPSRFGMMPAQFKAFFDATHVIWASQSLAGKPAGIFWSTGFHGGGQENSALTAITQLAHHGMIYVPLGYTFGDGMFEMNEVKGGSSYGAGTYAGDGSRKPTELELQLAFYQVLPWLPAFLFFPLGIPLSRRFLSLRHPQNTRGSLYSSRPLLVAAGAKVR